MFIAQKIKGILNEVLSDMNLEGGDIHLEHPQELSHGDYATNLALTLAKKVGKNPRALAEEILARLNQQDIPEVKSIEIAGPGFINFFLSDSFYEISLKTILKEGMDFGNLNIWTGKNILVEHSSPNLFKPFHIGHMMNNTVGESIARLCYLSGATTKVIAYPSDVSLGIGKAVWKLMDYGLETLEKLESLSEKMSFLGRCYAEGTQAMKEHPELEAHMREITQDIYFHRDTPAYAAYKVGRDLNLQYFIEMTARLGSVFDGYIFESEAGQLGKQIIAEHTGSVYSESNGAIVYEPSEEELSHNKKMHTRVFINKDGNPTYEAKDTGLLKLKFDRYKPDFSLMVTDLEQGPYFEVVAQAASHINPEWKERTKHLLHGRMKFKGQKMSSRLGNTPIVSDILDIVLDEVYDKAGEREMSKERADMIAIAALKYAILRTQPGKPINFDPDTSLSFEGDSGPYLQYTYARCRSILKKAAEENLVVKTEQPADWQVLDLEKQLYRLPEIFESAFVNFAPQQVVGYATEIAQLFNTWYGNTKIIDTDVQVGYRLALVEASATVIKKSLWALGIDAPEEM